MKLTRKIIAVILCLSFLTAIPFPISNAASYSPSNGEFVFSSESMLSYLTNAYSLDVTFDANAKAAKLEVNNTNNASDPQVLLNMNSLGLKAADYDSLLIIYRVPTDASYLASNTELFISAGSVTGPAAGKSVRYNVTKGSAFTSQIIDLSSLDWWTGSIYSIRIDAFNSASVGDTMYIDSVILCSDYSEAMNVRDERLAERNNVSAPEYAGTDYVCTSYQYDKYTAPLWKGNIVYNEAVYPIMDANGNAVYTLMYTPDEITSVYSADFSSYYYEGIDYTVSGNKITFLNSGSINLKDYYYIHPQSNPNGYSWDVYYNRTAAGDGKWERWGQSAEFFNGYINVSYTHSDTWNHYVPEQKSNEIPRTANKIANGGSMNVVFFGDSICGGANSSSYRNVYPYAEYWNEMIVSKLRNDYGCNVNVTYSAEGGGAAPNLVAKTDEWVTAYAPDLVFIEFGVNDAMNWSQDSSGSASGLKREFKSAIVDIIGEVRDTYPNCEFVLVAPFYANIYCHYMSYFEACRDALNEIAASYNGVTVADITSMHASLLEFKDYLDFSGDNMCHPNDYMARLYAQVCLETIVPGGVSAYTVNGEPPVVEPDTGNTTAASPGGYGWQWSSSEAYGYVGNYGTTSATDVTITMDVALISSAADEASLVYFLPNSDNNITITPSKVKIGNSSKSYDWGTADISNWHTVSVKFLNGAAYVYIDGALVNYVSSGITTYTTYQLPFSYTGVMAIDNVKITDSSGKVYVSCNFESESASETLMGTGLGSRTLLAANTVSYDLNGGSGEISNQIKVRNTPLTLTTDIPTRSGYTFLGWAKKANATTADFESGATYSSESSITLYAVWSSGSAPEPVYPEITLISPVSSTITDKGTAAYNIKATGDGLTYSWSCSDSTVLPYISGTETATLSVNIDKLLDKSFSATFVCTVTNSDGNSVESSHVSLNYVRTPDPTIDSVTPESANITDIGSAEFSVNAIGSGLTYSWTCSDSTLLPYISGTDSSEIYVCINELLAKSFSATLSCTVTDLHGRTVTSKDVVLNYVLTPAPAFSSITPGKATVTDTGDVTYTVIASGNDLVYSWTCSNEKLLPYVSGTDTADLTVSIPEKLSEELSATFSCTVTDVYGRTAVSDTVTFEYKLTPESEPEIIPGDITGDGSINAQDVNILKRFMSGSANITDRVLKAADISGDGILNGLDSNLLTRLVAGII